MNDFLHDTVSYALARTGMAHRASAFALLADVGLHPGQEFLLQLARPQSQGKGRASAKGTRCSLS